MNVTGDKQSRTRGPRRIATHDHPKRYVHVRRPRCPQCKGTRLGTYGTAHAGDGSVSRYTLCKGCGWRFTVVEE